MSEPQESAAAEPPFLAWHHLTSSALPELRRWLNSAQPMGLHGDLMMVAVPNPFTRNQLENRFKADIESSLTGYYSAPIKLVVVVDDTLQLPEPPAGFDAGAEFADYGRSGVGDPDYPVTGEPEHNGARIGGSPLSDGHRDPGTFNDSDEPRPRRDSDEPRPRREPDARLNPSTPSRLSSSVPRTVSPMRRRSRSPRARASPITR